MPPKKLVSIIRNFPPLECNGFGIVQGIDLEKGVLYLLTPFPDAKFNTLIQGAVHIPGDLYADTNLADPNFFGIGLLDKIGASTDPLMLKNTPVFD